MQLCNEAKTIIKDFSDLIFHIRNSLKDRKIDPQDLATTALGTSTCESSTVALMESLDIAALHSVDMLMSHLLQNGYISFFNYHIVQDLIDKYGTEKDKDEFCKYETKFKVYCKRSIFEIPTYVVGTIPCDSEILAFKVTKEMVDNLRSNSCCNNDTLSPTMSQQISSKTLHLTLESTLSVQVKVAEALGVLDSVGRIIFVSVHRGCIELTFSIPSSIIDTLKPQLRLHSEVDKKGFANLESAGILILCGPPGKPYATSVAVDRITIRWTKPEVEGSYPLLYYRILYCSLKDPSRKWRILLTKCFTEEGEINVPSNRPPFLFKVQAVSDIGAGVQSESSDPIDLIKPSGTNVLKWSTIVLSKPGKPRAVNVTPNSIHLEWTKPVLNTDDSIRSYTILYRSTYDRPNHWMEHKVVGMKEEAVVSQLSENTTYIFQIQTECEAGIGSESDISDPIKTKMIIPSKPGRPQASKVTHDSVQLEWTKPEQGAHNITSYTVLYQSTTDPPEKLWSEHKAVTKEEVLLPKLVANTIYWFKIRPECIDGSGLESDISATETKRIPPIH